MAQSTELVQRLDDIVEIANQNSEWRRQRMTLAQKILEEKEESRLEGMQEGKQEEQNLLSRLIGILVAQNRFADLKVAAENPAILEKLLREYQLI